MPFSSWFLIIDSTASDMSIDTNVRFKQYVIPLYGSYWVISIFKPMKYAMNMRTIGKYIKISLSFIHCILNLINYSVFKIKSRIFKTNITSLISI
jgi:hypothetical protein